MRAVHIGVRHDDDLAVAAIFDVELFANARAERLMIVRISSCASILTRLAFSTFRILPLSGRIAWISLVSALFGRAAGGITFDEEQLGSSFDLERQSDSLPGNALPSSDSFAGSVRAPSAPPRALRPRACPFRRSALASLGFSSKYAPSRSLTAELTNPSTSLLPSLVLVWPFKLRLGHLHADDGDQPFAHVIAARPVSFITRSASA